MKNSKLHTTEDKSNEKVTSSNSKSEDTLGCEHCSGKNDKPGWRGSYSDDGYIGYTQCWNCNKNGITPEPPQDTSLDVEERMKNWLATDDYIEFFVYIANIAGQEDYHGYAGGNKPEIPFEDACILAERSIKKLLANQRAKLFEQIRSEAELYNVKSINGEIVKPNTGILAVPLEALTRLESEQ